MKVSIETTYFEDFFTDERFDIIICGFVLEHVENPGLILRKYANMLAPKGKIFITVPNAEALNRRIGEKAGLLRDIYELSEHDVRCGHRRYYTTETLEKEIRNAGMKVVLREGIFLKPFTTAQMINLNLTESIIEGLLAVGKDYPELCLGLLYEVERIR